MLYASSGKAQNPPRNPASGDYRLTATWEQGGIREEIKAWSLNDLSGLKKVSTQERDPMTGKLSQWNGVLLSQVVDHAMQTMPAERKAQVDLVVLKNTAGGQAFIPRALIVKYPMLLALQRDQKSLGDLGPVYSVVPWTSKTKIQQEGVPLEKFFLPQVTQVELTNYRERYSGLYLKRRTDPAAMRGEKLFVQQCVTCHADRQNPTILELASGEKTREVASAGKHPEVKGTPSLTDKDKRSLKSYLEAYRAENSGTVQASTQ